MKTYVLLIALAVLVSGCSQGKTVELSSTFEGQFEPAVIEVKAGTPVKIIGDPETLAGGMDTVIIEGYGINKRISPGDNTIEFIADKPGEFDMICANGMGNGKLIVVP